MYKKALSREDKEEIFKLDQEKRDIQQLAHCNGYKRIYPNEDSELQARLEKVMSVIAKDSNNNKKCNMNLKNFLGNKISSKLNQKDKDETKIDDSNKPTKSKEEVNSIVNRLY